MRATRVLRLPPRERVLDAAEELFFSEGIRRVTVDAIATRAETTKAAVYRHFESKEALVAEWLRIVTAQYAEVLDRLEAEHPDDPRAQLLGFVRFIVDGLEATSYRGCPFINSLAELPESDDPARRIIEDHKARQVRRIRALCERIGSKDPELAAAQITFILEGAQVSAQNRSLGNIGSVVERSVEGILSSTRG
nr:TetR/AcrR family transcriptional regulator [Methylobacterium sp. OT2]